jgi:hypothetical protein
VSRASPLAVAVVAALALVLPATAGATEPASTYDADGQRHADACVPPLSPAAQLRYLDGTPTGFAIPDPLSFTDGSCPSGDLRIDLHEIVDSPLGPLVFARGGNGYTDDQNAKYGQVRLADLAADPGAPTPSGDGRGEACQALTGATYEEQVASIPAEMHYKPPAAGGSNSGSSFLHYGDPGADQGDRHDIHYSYLLWSFLDAHGGGHVRALLAPGQLVQPCDVDPILMDSWDGAGNVNGTVLARYVRTEEGGTPLYGWMVWEHRSGDDPVVAHQALVSGPPVAMPPGLPVSPPVSNPVPADHGPNPATAARAAPPPPPPAPPPPPPVAMKAALQLARKATLDAHGRLVVPIACTGTAASACAGTLRLDAVLPAAKGAKRAGRWSTLASTRYAVRAGGAASATLLVRSALRTRLPRGRAVRARVLLDGAPQALTLVRR